MNTTMLSAFLRRPNTRTRGLVAGRAFQRSLALTTPLLVDRVAASAAAPAHTESRLVAMGANEEAMARVSLRLDAASRMYFCVQVSELPTVDAARKAASKLKRAHPVFNSCVVTSDMLNDDLKKPLAFLENPGFETLPVRQLRSNSMLADALVELSKDTAKHMKLNEPAHEIVLLTTKSGSAIVFAIDHLAGDGASLVEFAHDFLRLACESQDSEVKHEGWSVPMCEFGTTSLKARAWYGFVKTLIPAILSKNDNLTPHTPNQPDAQLAELNETSRVHVDFSEEETAIVKKSLKANGATWTTGVTAALLHAFGKEISDRLGRPAKLRVSLVADARRVVHTINKRTMTPAVASFNLAPSAEFDGNEDFDLHSLSRATRLDLSKELDDNIHKVVHIQHAFMSMLPTSQMMPTFSLSSWGANSPIELKYGSVEVLDFRLEQPSHFLSEPLVSLYPSNPRKSGMRFTVFFPHPRHSDEAVERVANRAKAYLLAAAAA